MTLIQKARNKFWDFLDTNSLPMRLRIVRKALDPRTEWDTLHQMYEWEQFEYAIQRRSYDNKAEAYEMLQRLLKYTDIPEEAKAPVNELVQGLIADQYAVKFFVLKQQHQTKGIWNDWFEAKARRECNDYTGD